MAFDRQVAFSMLVSSALAMTAPVVEESPRRRMSEVWSQKQVEAAGFVWRGNHTITPLPHEMLGATDLPDEFSWCDQGLCTMSRNQHIPQCNMLGSQTQKETCTASACSPATPRLCCKPRG